MRWQWLALARAKGSAVKHVDSGGFEELKAVCWDGVEFQDGHDELQGRLIDGEGKSKMGGIGEDVVGMN
jgi:hypothetical protein